MSDEQMKRSLIFSTAKTQADIKSHYLNGTDGGTPGNKDGQNHYLLEIKENLTEEHVSVYAVTNKNGTCSGRTERVLNGKKLVKPNQDRTELLPAYLEELKSSWKSYFYYPDFNNTGLYPRREDGWIFLGEDCRGKRHFDCQSFIGWVIGDALKKTGIWGKSIEWFNNGGDGKLDVWQGSAMPAKSEMLDGDILIRLQTTTNKKGQESTHRHIAFVSRGGNTIVHASGNRVGVISQLLSANPTWTALARIKSQYL